MLRSTRRVSIALSLVVLSILAPNLSASPQISLGLDLDIMSRIEAVFTTLSNVFFGAGDTAQADFHAEVNRTGTKDLNEFNPSADPNGFNPSADPNGFNPSADPNGLKVSANAKFNPSADPNGFNPSADPNGFNPSADPNGYSVGSQTTQGYKPYGGPNGR